MVYQKVPEGSGKEKQVAVSAPDETLKGVYSNHLITIHTREEFVLDFFNLFPPKGILSARVITSPGHLKRFIRVLSKTMENFEKQFGKVTEAEEPGGDSSPLP